MTQTQWKHSSREGFTGNNNEAEDSHTRSILEKLNKLKKIKAVVCMYNGGEPNNYKQFFKLKKKYKCEIVGNEKDKA